MLIRVLVVNPTIPNSIEKTSAETSVPFFPTECVHTEGFLQQELRPGCSLSVPPFFPVNSCVMWFCFCKMPICISIAQARTKSAAKVWLALSLRPFTAKFPNKNGSCDMYMCISTEHTVCGAGLVEGIVPVKCPSASRLRRLAQICA